MPAEPIVWLIMDDMQQALRGILQGQGYWWDVGTVCIGRISPVEGEPLPIVSVLPVQDVPDAGPSSVKRRVFTCTTRLWIDVEEADAPRLLEYLKHDVSKALMLDVRRGGHAEDTRELAYTYWYQLTTERLAGANIGWDIYYRTRLDDAAASPA